MRPSFYRITILFLTLVSLSALSGIVFTLDPSENGVEIKILFWATLFFSLTGILALISSFFIKGATSFWIGVVATTGIVISLLIF